MNKYGDNYCGAWLLHDKYRVLVPRDEYYNIPIFQRRKLRHRGGSLGNEEQRQDSNAGSWTPRLGSGDRVTNESLLFEDALVFPASKRFVL